MNVETADFGALSPELALSAVEEAFGVVPDGSFQAYPSYVNRVYGFGTDDGRAFVVKFYRPGRWSPDAVSEEHEFVRELAAAEVPVVEPLPTVDGGTVAELGLEGPGGESVVPFALYPKRAGRSFDADGPEDLLRLGALAGRIHAVGALRKSRHRTVIGPGLLGRLAGELLDSGAVHPDAEPALSDALREAAGLADDAFERVGARTIRLHGDFHRGNVLDRVGEGLLAIDFDDMSSGPAVQDLWMLLPGRMDQSPAELEAAIRGYEAFMPFDPAELTLVEPLRLLRMVHYLAWQARQRQDRGFADHFPGWGGRGFWFQELEDLRNQSGDVYERQ